MEAHNAACAMVTEVHAPAEFPVGEALAVNDTAAREQRMMDGYRERFGADVPHIMRQNIHGAPISHFAGMELAKLHGRTEV